jgi:hypothetical protein
VACGATFTQKTGDEYVFVAPWDEDRDAKLYARVKDGTLVFDDKRGGGGNLSTFLGKMFDAVYEPALTKAQRQAFARSLRLPSTAANNIELGWDDLKKTYVLPGRSRTGHVWDLRRLIDGQWQTTWRCSPQLLWADRLHNAAGRAGEMWVYVAEGEKDAIALRWRLRTLGIDAVVLAVPGAKTFNEKWVSLFKGHHVRLCYDNDKAGQEGSAKAVRLLRGVAAKLDVLHWPENIRDGYDVRDWIVYAIEHEVPASKSWAGLEELFGPPAEVDDERSTRFKLLTVAEVEAQKPPPFLIDGILQANSTTVLYAPPGVGKSFVAMSWAGSIAAGVPWLGREVIKGAVLYIAAEGRGGLGVRLRALRAGWKQRGIVGDLADLAILADAPQFLERDQADEITRLAETLDEKPVLLVVDPLARTAVGADENSTSDVGRWIDSVDRIGHRLGCARLVLHHSLKSAKTVERGSSSLRGAADAMFCLVDQGHGRIRLVCDKAKDFEAPEPVDLVLRGHEFADGTSSCYVAPGIDMDAVLAGGVGPHQDRVLDREILKFLAKQDREQDRVATAVAKHVKKTSNYVRKRLSSLISSGFVSKRRDGKADYYTVRKGAK